jgi:hypothetical protein
MTDALTPHILTDSGQMGRIAVPVGAHLTLTEIGLVISGDLTFDDFCTGLKQCQGIANGALWTLGDLLVYGESRGEWGEMYSQALDLTKKSYSTLTQAVHISKRYPRNERVVAVSWSHHREAAQITDPQERRQLLERAGAEGWSREQVRDHVRGTDMAPTTPLRNSCPKCGHQW